MPITERLSVVEHQAGNEAIVQLRSMARPLDDPSDLDPLLDRIGNARYVLLGEASHGTAEFYTWRQRISQRLIREKGFRFIAVEGDWPDCYQVNRYVRGLAAEGTGARQVLQVFQRWPTWMWANEQVADLVEWLRRHNDPLPAEEKAGFYGLDVYSLWESLAAVIEYLRQHEPSALAAALGAYRCFEPFEDVQEYARATAWIPTSCEEQVVEMLAELRKHAPRYPDDGNEDWFNAEQNALVAKNAERYYRTMARGGPESWNVRDRHMTETLDRLMEHHGPSAKAIVWEHNTHIGDARATDMAAAGMVNVGQLVRERHQAEGVVLVGFASHRGTVIAGEEWGAPMRRMQVPPARQGSWDDLLHQAGPHDQLLVFDRPAAALAEPRGHRAIGVVYHPQYERHGNYVPTLLSRRYDALLFIDESRALDPLAVKLKEEGEVPETYPFAV